MKQLTDAERLVIAVPLLDSRGLMEYTERCSELEQDCERNGFHDVPAECEQFECRNCTMADSERRVIDCPYIDYWIDNEVIK